MRPHEVYLRRIVDAYPDLDISAARIDEAGMNNLVLIANEEYVFRFPRYTQGLAGLREETRLLTKLAGQLPVSIPQPEYVRFTDSPEQSFCGYKMLPGEPLRGSELSSGPGRFLCAAGQLGSFLKQLHSLPLKHFLPDAKPRRHLEHWQDFYSQVRDRLYQYMRPEARIRVDAFFQEHLASEIFNFQDVLIHGDFGPSNILWDRERGRISGVIDFGSSGSGDPAQDIAALLGPRGYGLEFVYMMKGSYPGLEALIYRAQFYTGTFALQDALHGLRHNDCNAFREGIAPYI